MRLHVTNIEDVVLLSIPEDGARLQKIVQRLTRYTSAEIEAAVAALLATGDVVDADGWLVRPVKRGRVGEGINMRVSQ